MTPERTWKIGLIVSPILGSSLDGIISILRQEFNLNIINIGIYLLTISIVLIPFLIRLVKNEDDIQDLVSIITILFITIGLLESIGYYIYNSMELNISIISTLVLSIMLIYGMIKQSIHK